MTLSSRSNPATLSTHVLDLKTGKPAAGLAVRLLSDQGKQVLGRNTTDADGRISDWSMSTALEPGSYVLVFETGDWFEAQQQTSLYPKVEIHFMIAETGSHYHIPLLLSPYGYSTYRGS